MSQRSPVQRYRWDDMPKETVNPLLDRRLITGERMMLTHGYLKKGCVVPKHSHDNEQFTYILEGALRFWIGEDGAETFVLRLGGPAKHVVEAAGKSAELAATASVAAERALARTESGGWILLKASRGMKLERVLDEMKEQTP